MSHYPPPQQTREHAYPTWEEQPRYDDRRYDGDTIADSRGMSALAAKDVRRYGIVLLICGGLHAEMAMVFALTGWPIAALAALVVTIVMLIGLAWWTNSRPNTLRLAAWPSRLLWSGSSVVWLASHTLFFSAGAVWVWWISAVLLLGLGVGAYALCRRIATTI